LKRDKKKGVDDGGVPEWMVSYGDVMSLLLTFFVLLFSFSTIDAQKWKELVNSFTGEVSVIEIEQKEETAVINLTDYKTGADDAIIDKPENREDIATDPADIDNPEDEVSIEDEQFEEIYEKIQEIADNNNIDAEFQVIKTLDKIILRFDNQLLFASGEATMDSTALDVLAEISPVINDYEDLISTLMVEGNTDNVPVKNLIYKDNFELSTQRALVVLYYLRDDVGFPPDKLVSVGRGEYNPIADNTTEEGRSQNRRTDIILVKTLEDL